MGSSNSKNNSKQNLSYNNNIEEDKLSQNIQDFNFLESKEGERKEGESKEKEGERKEGQTSLKKIGRKRKYREIDDEKDNNSCNVVLWTRVSSDDQKNNDSLNQQRDICFEYLKYNEKNYPYIKDIKLHRIINSAYTINNNIKNYYSLLLENKNTYIICYSVDRFSRNYNYGKKIYEELKEKGSKLFFINEKIDTSIEEGEKKFLECLKLSEEESKIKGNKIKDIKYNNTKNLFIQSLNNNNIISQNIKNITNFVVSMIDGDFIQNINNNLKKIVDWEKHSEWKENFYENPIHFNDSIIKKINEETKEEMDFYNIEYSTEEERYKSVQKLLNDYDIDIPIEIRNKKWSIYLIKIIYKELKNKKTLDELIDSIHLEFN
jgi:hypothetical protein